MADQPTAWALADVDLTRHGVHRVVHPPTYWLDALRAELRHAEAEDAIEHPIRSLKLSGTDDDESSSVRITLEKGSWIELSQEEPVSVQLRTWDDDSPIVAEATVISDAPKHVRIEMSRDDNRVRELIEAHPKQDPKHVFQEVRLSTLRAKALLELMTEFKDVAKPPTRDLHRPARRQLLQGNPEPASPSRNTLNAKPAPSSSTPSSSLAPTSQCCSGAHPARARTYTLSAHRRPRWPSRTSAFSSSPTPMRPPTPCSPPPRDAVDRRLRPRCRRHGRLPDGAKIMLKDEDIRSSSIIATTAARAIRESDRLHDFDAVLIDEASMLMVPAIAVIASRCHAKGQFVAAGDFCQLPAVIKTHDENAQAILERDVFDTSGVVDTLQAHAARTAESPDPGETPPAPILPTHCAALRVQQRMNTPIMDIANEFGYVWHPLVQGKHAEETPELAPLLGNQVPCRHRQSAPCLRKAPITTDRSSTPSAPSSAARSQRPAPSPAPRSSSPAPTAARPSSSPRCSATPSANSRYPPNCTRSGPPFTRCREANAPTSSSISPTPSAPLSDDSSRASPRATSEAVCSTSRSPAPANVSSSLRTRDGSGRPLPDSAPSTSSCAASTGRTPGSTPRTSSHNGLDANVRKLPPANHTDHPVQNGGVIPVDHTTTHIQVGVDEDRYEVKSLLVAAQLNAMSANRRPFPPRRRASYRSRASIPA